MTTRSDEAKVSKNSQSDIVEELGEPTSSTAAYRAVYPYARVMLALVARTLAPRLRISGQYHVPRRGAVILAPNHVSDSDPPFVLNGSPRPLWFMAKRELFLMKVLGLEFGRIIRFCQAFPVDPCGADRAALRHTEELLKAQQAVVVFPEGRCSEDGEFQDISAGVVLLALRSRAPIVPVGLWNTQRVMPYAQTVPRPTLARVRVHYGKPIPMNDIYAMPRREQREAATERLEQAMRAARAIAMRG